MNMTPRAPRVLFVGLVSLSLAIASPAFAIPRPGQSQATALDTAAIAGALGRTGQSIGDVYKVTFPRSDLRVTVNGVTVLPGLALTGWAAFKAASGGAVAHGDLALTQTEVNPVITRLRADGIEITAIHNHLLGESPRVMFVHFWGQGPAVRLAESLKAAVALTAIPAPRAPAANPAVPGADPIQQILGLKGTVAGGVLGLAKPRPEPITMMGVTLPPAMGMATSMNFQAAGAGKVASTGDFVLTADEVNPAMSALRAHGIEVTALHNHMIHGSPELYFMHFWADDTPERVAEGLKAALDVIGRPAGDMRN